MLPIKAFQSTASPVLPSTSFIVVGTRAHPEEAAADAEGSWVVFRFVIVRRGMFFEVGGKVANLEGWAGYILNIKRGSEVVTDLYL